MSRMTLTLACLFLGACFTPPPMRRDITVSAVRLDCPSLGTVTALDEEGLRRQAASRGANHVVVTGERQEASGRTRPRGDPRGLPSNEAYFTKQRWMDGEALRCGASARPRLPTPY
jgi:hypothetical protein